MCPLTVPSTPLAALYLAAFIKNCHVLLALAYEQLDSASLHSAEETEITGELVRAMREVVEDPSAPTWMHAIAIHDDPPQSVSGLLGKRRPRVDIEMERMTVGRRPRFQFEAKRLHNKTSIGEYLGKDGLEMFISGRYAREHSAGGMLGYVQAAGAWIEVIKTRINTDKERFSLASGGDFVAIPEVSPFHDVHRSIHNRSTPRTPISMYHSFLSFRIV